MQSSIIPSSWSLRLLCGKQGSYMTDDVRVLAYNSSCSFWARRIHCVTNSQASWSSCRPARCTHALMQTVLAMMHHGIAARFIEGCVQHILGISQCCFRKRVIFCMHIYEKVPQPLSSSFFVACLKASPWSSTTCCHSWVCSLSVHSPRLAEPSFISRFSASVCPVSHHREGVRIPFLLGHIAYRMPILIRRLICAFRNSYVDP